MNGSRNTLTIPPELEAEMTPAVRAFVEMPLARIDELETRLGKTPQNSSLPPSAQHPHAKPAPPKPKSSERTVTLPKSVVDALHERRKQNLAEGNGASPWVFCAPMGGVMWDSCLRRKTKKLMKKVGVPVIKVHEMRHFMPTSLLAADVNPKIVSRQLGHSSVKMTLDRYSHPNTEHQRQVSDAMESLMNATRERRKLS